MGLVRTQELTDFYDTYTQTPNAYLKSRIRLSVYVLDLILLTDIYVYLYIY